MEKQMTILSIDDDEEILYALQALLNFQGWKSVIASDVENGLKAFWKYSPDIVLMDYHLPKVNGIEGVRMLRQFSNDVPIIVFTIDEDQEVANRFLEVGASDFALKPIKAPDLISRINLHIRLMEHHQKIKFSVSPQVHNDVNEENLVKGISPTTLNLIIDSLKNQDKYIVAEEIADETGLAYQTVYRYLQYMESENMLEIHTAYGKVGRPKNSYKFLK